MYHFTHPSISELIFVSLLFYATGTLGTFPLQAFSHRDENSVSRGSFGERLGLGNSSKISAQER